LFHDKEWQAGVGRAGVEHVGDVRMVHRRSTKLQAPSSKEALILNLQAKARAMWWLSSAAR
jgi:hypothetical protein